MRITIGLMLLVLVGCATSGGDIGGLVPAPKNTKGSLVDGVYTASDHSFSVLTPFSIGSYEYRYMEIEELAADSENQVAFWSTPMPAEVYRVNVLNQGKRQESLDPQEDIKDLLLASAVGIFEGAYDTPLEPLETGIHSAGIPERGGGLRDRFMRAPAITSHHSAYIAKQGDKVVLLWINRPLDGSGFGGTAQGRQEAEDRERRFVDSFQFLSLGD